MTSKGGWIAAFKHDWRSALWAYASASKRRMANRLMDRNARLAGACNATTWSEALHSFRGGYAHWRCSKAAGHPGWHRFNNSRWAPGPSGRVLYDPLPVRRDQSTWNSPDPVIPFQKEASGRHMTPTSRQDRLMTRLAEANLRLSRQRRLRETTGADAD